MTICCAGPSVFSYYFFSYNIEVIKSGYANQEFVKIIRRGPFGLRRGTLFPMVL